MANGTADFSANVWELALVKLKNVIDEKTYQTWFSTTTFWSFDNKTLTIGVPDAYNKSWISSNYLGQISAVVQSITKQDIDILFHVHDKLTSEKHGHTKRTASSDKSQELASNGNLNLRYTFSNFVVGETNRFAHAAAIAVSDPTSKTYNPLFIYGGVGLGKTHLMQAIGFRLIENDPKAKVLYVSSEQFMNAFIDAITSNKQSEFRMNFRNVDLLLIDDIEFFAGKERTQEEFFHTFNSLHGAGKKIVITSDRPPKEIATLEERLRNRFEWGLTVDIQPPDFETRVAILNKKAVLDNVVVPKDVAMFIAERVKSNIRELEGALLKVQAYAKVAKASLIDLSLAKEALGSLLVSEQSDRSTVDHIQLTVCEYFDISVSELIGTVRRKKFTMPRHIAQHLCRELTRLSYSEIGKLFGHRDHTSVLHACRKIERDLKSDPNMRNITDFIRRKTNEKL